MSSDKTEYQGKKLSQAIKRKSRVEVPIVSTGTCISSDENSTDSFGSGDTGRQDFDYDTDEELLPSQVPDKSKLRKNSDSKPYLSNKMKAVIFINIFCVFDTCDNINAKSAMLKGVGFLDLAFSRIALNFVSACFFVFIFKKKVFTDVPKEFRS